MLSVGAEGAGWDSTRGCSEGVLLARLLSSGSVLQCPQQPGWARPEPGPSSLHLGLPSVVGGGPASARRLPGLEVGVRLSQESDVGRGLPPAVKG